jgi:hypothetical protein
MACRRLVGEIEMMADEVLPPMSDEEKALIADALDKRGRP